jgi:hypothetical protein
MHFVHLTSILIAILQFEYVLCYKMENSDSDRIPAPVLLCDLVKQEQKSLMVKRVSKGKRPVPRRKEVIEDVLHEVIGRAVDGPVKEPHASGTYEYDESNSSTIADDVPVGQIVVEPNHAEVHSNDNNSEDQQTRAPEGVSEENEHQQADGEIEYSMCEDSTAVKKPVLRKKPIVNLV